MPSNGHSPKTAQTIEMMDTKPESWGIAPITWRMEERDMLIRVVCKECHGKGIIYSACTYNGEVRSQEAVYNELKESGKIVTGYENYDAPNYVPFDKFYRSAEIREAFGVKEIARFSHDGKCPKCYQGQGRKGPGVVWEFRENVKCNVGYPAWPAGTTFPSRFNGCDCEACGKNKIKSGTIPVMARTNDGGHVGMYVGNACVKRFGLEQFKSVDEQSKKWALANGQKKGELVVTIYERSKKVQESVKIEVKGKEFSCPHCEKSFGSRQGRYNHIRKHHA